MAYASSSSSPPLVCLPPSCCHWRGPCLRGRGCGSPKVTRWVLVGARGDACVVLHRCSCLLFFHLSPPFFCISLSVSVSAAQAVHAPSGTVPSPQLDKMRLLCSVADYVLAHGASADLGGPLFVLGTMQRGFGKVFLLGPVTMPPGPICPLLAASTVAAPPETHLQWRVSNLSFRTCDSLTGAPLSLSASLSLSSPICLLVATLYGANCGDPICGLTGQDVRVGGPAGGQEREGEKRRTRGQGPAAA